MYRAVGWVGGRESYATIDEFSSGKLKVQGHIAGRESYAVLTRLDTRRWTVSGSIGGLDILPGLKAGDSWTSRSSVFCFNDPRHVSPC